MQSNHDVKIETTQTPSQSSSQIICGGKKPNKKNSKVKAWAAIITNAILASPAIYLASFFFAMCFGFSPIVFDWELHIIFALLVPCMTLFPLIGCLLQVMAHNVFKHCDQKTMDRKILEVLGWVLFGIVMLPIVVFIIMLVCAMLHIR